MMPEPVVGRVVAGLKGVAAMTLLFGAWSARDPGRSIALYQAIMRLCNWRVEPIDVRRERITTCCLGAALVACSLLSLWLLW